MAKPTPTGCERETIESSIPSTTKQSTLAGHPQSDAQAVVPLYPVNGSDWYGIAILSGSKSVPVVGTNQTKVTVYLFQTKSGTTATPAA